MEETGEGRYLFGHSCHPPPARDFQLSQIRPRSKVLLPCQWARERQVRQSIMFRHERTIRALSLLKRCVARKLQLCNNVIVFIVAILLSEHSECLLKISISMFSKNAI